MIEAYQTVLKLIDAGLKEKNISISELKINKVVGRILKEQTFLPFLYKVTAEEKFKTFYFLSALYSEEIDNLTSLVNTLKGWFDRGYDKYEIQNNCYRIIDEKYNPYRQIEIINKVVNS